MAANVVKEGRLSKLPSSGAHGRPKQRLFRLTSSQLSYAEERPRGKQPTIKGTISLDSILRVGTVPYEKTQKSCGFSITYREREQRKTKELVMFGASEVEIDEWMEAILAVKEGQPWGNGSLHREGVLAADEPSEVELSTTEDHAKTDETSETILVVQSGEGGDVGKTVNEPVQDEIEPDVVERSISPDSALGVSFSSQGRLSSNAAESAAESAALVSSNTASSDFEPCDDTNQAEISQTEVVEAVTLGSVEDRPLATEDTNTSIASEQPSALENPLPDCRDTKEAMTELVSDLEQVFTHPSVTSHCPMSPSTLKRSERRTQSSSCLQDPLYLDANPLDKITDGLTQLHVACQQGNVEKVNELLVGGADPSVCDTIAKRPCLFHAYIHDHKEVLKVLLHHDCDPGIEEQTHGTQVLHLCAQNGDIPTAKILLKHGAKIDAHDYQEITPLFLACKSDKFAMVQFLLESGADVNRFGEGQTCLHIASARGDEKLAEVLLRHGANVRNTDRPNHQTPYDLAVANKWDKVAEMLRAAQPEESRAYSCVHVLKGHKEIVSALAYAAVDLIASGDENGMVILWNPVNGEQLHSIHLNNPVVCASFWKSYLVVSTEVVTVWDLEHVGWKLEINAEGTGVSSEERPLQLVAVAPDGLLAVVDIDSNQIELWSTGPVEGFVRRPVQSIVADSVLGDKEGVCHSLTFSPDITCPLLAASIQPGTRLSSTGNNLIHLYNWKTGDFKRVIDMGSPSDTSEVCMAFSPHGRYLAAGSSCGTICMWEMSDRFRLLHRLVATDGSAILAMAFSLDGTHLAAACQSGKIQLFCVQNGDSLFVLSEHQRAVTALAYSSDGRLLVSASKDKTVRVWKVSDRDVGMAAADCEVQPSYSPERAVTAAGELTAFSRHFWEREFKRFDEDKDGVLRRSEFNKYYVEYTDQHILPGCLAHVDPMDCADLFLPKTDEFAKLLGRHNLPTDSGVTLEVLYKEVRLRFLKNIEGMWKKWVEHGLRVEDM